MIVFLEKRRIQMDHGKAMGGMSMKKRTPTMPTGGPNRKKKRTPPKMVSRSGGGRKRMMAMGGGKKERSMYMEGGEAHSGAQPTYGSTVADAMPKGMKN